MEDEFPDSLWSLIKQVLKPSEQNEIERIIGTERIEHHYSLWREVTSLNEILEQLELENDELHEKLQSRPGLPEHPERLMLRNQIRLLLEKLHPDCDNFDGKEIMKKNVASSEREKKIVEFVLDNDNKSLRPSSDCSMLSTTRKLSSRKGVRPLTGSSRPSSARSMRSAPDMLEHMKHHLTVSEVDKILRDLTITFEEEETELMAEINELQLYIEEEMRSKITTEKKGIVDSSPTITELKNYNKKLQEQWLQEDYVRETLSKLQVSDNQTKESSATYPAPWPQSCSFPEKNSSTWSSKGIPQQHEVLGATASSDKAAPCIPSSSKMSSRLRQTVKSSKDNQFLSDDDVKFFV